MKEHKKQRTMASSMIKNARLEKDLSQLDLANRLGYSNASMVSQVESGVTRLPPDKIKLFCDALGLNKEELINAMILDYGKELWAVAI